jgi:hypothetical protein
MQQPSPGWQPPQPPNTAAANIPNYLVPAILATLCCACGMPFGIVSIIYATQVNSKAAAGDIQGAMDASSKAKMWFIIAIVVGLLGGIASGILQLLVGARR